VNELAYAVVIGDAGKRSPLGTTRRAHVRLIGRRCGRRDARLFVPSGNGIGTLLRNDGIDAVVRE
jgi:hypothetical protein